MNVFHRTDKSGQLGRMSWSDRCARPPRTTEALNWITNYDTGRHQVAANTLNQHVNTTGIVPPGTWQTTTKPPAGTQQELDFALKRIRLQNPLGVTSWKGELDVSLETTPWNNTKTQEAYMGALSCARIPNLGNPSQTGNKDDGKAEGRIDTREEGDTSGEWIECLKTETVEYGSTPQKEEGGSYENRNGEEREGSDSREGGGQGEWASSLDPGIGVHNNPCRKGWPEWIGNYATIVTQNGLPGRCRSHRLAFRAGASHTAP